MAHTPDQYIDSNLTSGKFNTECPCEGETIADCPIGECECENQLRVNHDCSKARWVCFLLFALFLLLSLPN